MTILLSNQAALRTVILNQKIVRFLLLRNVGRGGLRRPRLRMLRRVERSDTNPIHAGPPQGVRAAAFGHVQTVLALAALVGRAALADTTTLPLRPLRSGELLRSGRGGGA